MTTNVYDRTVRLMATDSRWSVQYRHFVIYLDDSGFEKLEVSHGYAYMFAGSADLVCQWKTWLRSSPADIAGAPPFNGMAVCMVCQADGEEVFCRGANISNEHAVFAGSGSLFAHTCWASNRDARKSVDSAKKWDVLTGGAVKFFDMKTGDTNLVHGQNPITAAQMRVAMTKRGFVMENKADKSKAKSAVPFPLKDAAAANDPLLRDAADKIVSGELTPCAPCDAMHSEWTDDEKQRFAAALGVAFGWRK